MLFLKRRKQYLRRAWPIVVAPFIFSVMLSPLVLLLPGGARTFCLGALLASGFWAMAMLSVVLSGAAPKLAGQVAEQQVAQVLRNVRRRGWRLANHVSIIDGRGDIDHLVIGPCGVLVVETKYKADGWHDRFAEDRISQAVRAVQDRAREVVPFVQPYVPRDRVQPVLVLSGETSDADPVLDRQGVAVVPLARLAEWLAGRPDEQLRPEAVRAAWDKVLDRVAYLNRRDRLQDGPAARGLWDLFAGAVAFAGIGFVLDAELVRLTAPQWFVAIGSIAALAGVVAYRRRARRLWVGAWLLGTQVVTAVYSAAYIASAVTAVVR